MSRRTDSHGPRRARAASLKAIAPLMLLVAITATASATPPGKALLQERYLLHCSGCHASDGQGVPGTSPSLHGVGKFLSLPAGRAYLARVPGIAQAPLDDPALAELINWVLEEFSALTPDPLYTGPEVAALRRQPLRDTTSARAELEAALAGR